MNKFTWISHPGRPIRVDKSIGEEDWPVPMQGYRGEDVPEEQPWA